MKPIRLKIAGLNSFREVQEINFTKLCETGVFGIFGPTGSGKSSILDAITLALYGTVERAANNTQGILNHAEEKLSVEYSFSLAFGDQRVIYRAERAYRRAGERTVKAAACRLVEIKADTETVLASKADEMTRKIEEILGLTAEDFTRAVVLPQGKFSEFLTIKPKDRRVMLERLFSLEAYGRDLSARLGEQLEETRFKLNGLEQRLQGIGDASAEQVGTAEKEYAAVRATAEQTQKELNRLKQEFETAKELWNLQAQLEQTRGSEVQHTAAQAEMNLLEERLGLAERAESLRPILADLEQAEKQCQEELGRAGAAKERLAEARGKRDETEKLWLEKNRLRLEQEPNCLRQLEQLELARRLEEDIRTRSRQLEDTRNEYRRHSVTRNELERTWQNARELKGTLESRLKELKAKLASYRIDPDQRHRVSQSAQALEAYELVARQAEEFQADLEKNSRELLALESQRTESLQEMNGAQEVCNRLQAALTLSRQDPPPREDDLSKQAQELERYRNLLGNIRNAELEEREEQERLAGTSLEVQTSQAEMLSLEQEQGLLAAELQKLRELAEQKKEAVRALEQRDHAGFLVHALAEGEACPVCGSLQHPQPALPLQVGMLAEANRELEEAARQVQVLERRELEAAKNLAAAQAKLTGKNEQLQAQLRLLSDKRQKAAAYRAELPAENREQGLQALAEFLTEKEEALSRQRLRLNRWHQEQETLQHKLENARQALKETEERQHTLQAQFSALEGGSSKIRHLLNTSEQEKAERKSVLDFLRRDIPPAEIPQLQKQYAEWDEAANALNKEAAGLEEGVREKETELQGILERKNACELELQRLTTIGSEAGRTLEEMKDQCQALTGGQPASERIEAVKRELAGIVGDEERCKKDCEQAKQVYTQAEQALAVSVKAAELSRESLEAVRSKLQRGLEQSGFPSGEEVRSALCDPAEQVGMKQKLAAFREEGLLLGQRRQDIEGRLQGRSLEADEWLAWPARLKEAETAFAGTLEKRGAAQEKLLKLREKHEEWLSLERERQAGSHRLGLLKTLQTVLKANGFVEFLAQEQLTNVSFDASERLKQLTNHRYALEVDAEGGFIMRDDSNGGVRRPVNTLSGGETFLTSLALALALSAQIQLRGESPLEFFFLDEGFGTLDPNLLESVMNTLETLHVQNITIGIISHVPELRNRLARRLLVTAAEAGGAGSRVSLEMA